MTDRENFIGRCAMRGGSSAARCDAIANVILNISIIHPPQSNQKSPIVLSHRRPVRRKRPLSNQRAPAAGGAIFQKLCASLRAAARCLKAYQYISSALFLAAGEIYFQRTKHNSE